MTNLTRTAIMARKIIRYSIYGVIGIVVLRYSLLSAIRIYRYFFPSPPPAPTVEFGRLPKLPFPEKDMPDGLTYTLQTPTGELPVTPDQTRVYLMTRLSSQLLSLEGAKSKASKLGFSAEGLDITETVYKFPHEKSPSELRINIVTGVFSISYDLNKDPSPLDTLPPNTELATATARAFMSGAGLLPEDLTGPTLPEFVKLSSKKIVGAISQSNADFTKVHFFRKDYDELPSMTPDPKNANVWFIMSGETNSDKQVIAAEFHLFPIDETKFATYPIKSSLQAYEEMKAGKAFIASSTNADNSNVTIRRVYLANYDPGEAADFFQPIFVFEGDRGFVAYVPAVTSGYYEQAINQ